MSVSAWSAARANVTRTRAGEDALAQHHAVPKSETKLALDGLLRQGCDPLPGSCASRRQHSMMFTPS